MPVVTNMICIESESDNMPSQWECEMGFISWLSPSNKWQKLNHPTWKKRPTDRLHVVGRFRWKLTRTPCHKEIRLKAYITWELQHSSIARGSYLRQGKEIFKTDLKKRNSKLVSLTGYQLTDGWTHSLIDRQTAYYRDRTNLVIVEDQFSNCWRPIY